MLSDSNPLNKEAKPQAQTYVYPSPVLPGGVAQESSTQDNPSTLERLWGASSAPPFGFGLDSEEQIRAREALARKEGRDEGLAQALAESGKRRDEALAQALVESEKKLAGERQALVQGIREFARMRETYFQQVEAEVIGLTLAIARKILHREAQVDPLLLAGVVRVGLDNVAAGTRVRLRVHPDQIQTWQEFFSQQHNLQSLPELMGDPTLGREHCLLETELGSTDLTLETQLKEIEQGFFDLLAQKPRKSA